MIFDLIIGALLALVEGVLSLFPTFTAPTLAPIGGAIGSALSTAAGWFPVATLGACLAAVFAVRLFMVGFNVVMWVYRQFPFKGT